MRRASVTPAVYGVVVLLVPSLVGLAILAASTTRGASLTGVVVHIQVPGTGLAGLTWAAWHRWRGVTTLIASAVRATVSLVSGQVVSAVLAVGLLRDSDPLTYLVIGFVYSGFGFPIVLCFGCAVVLARPFRVPVLDGRHPLAVWIDAKVGR